MALKSEFGLFKVI